MVALAHSNEFLALEDFWEADWNRLNNFGWTGNFSHTKSGFTLFYPCEIILSLSHIPVPALGKDKKTNSRTSAARRLHVDPWRHWNIKMRSPCRISAFSGFSRSLFLCFFPILNEVFSREQRKKKHYSCEDGIEKSVTRITEWHHKAKNPSLAITVFHHSASPVMPIGDARDGFFYPTLTLMMDSYNHRFDQWESF